MKWLARAALTALILAALYGLYVAPVTTNGAIWPIPTNHTHVLWFILVGVAYVAAAVAALAALIVVVVWCVRTGWPEEQS